LASGEEAGSGKNPDVEEAVVVDVLVETISSILCLREDMAKQVRGSNQM